MTGSLLKLVAADAEDLKLVSAMLQDAIAPVSEMTFRGAEKSFVMAVHRFRWDRVDGVVDCTEEGPCFERVQAAIDIEGVAAVRCAGFDPSDTALMLDLLTIKLENGCLCPIFAGGMEMRLELESKWRLRVEDFGESWPTRRIPSHQA